MIENVLRMFRKRRCFDDEQDGSRRRRQNPSSHSESTDECIDNENSIDDDSNNPNLAAWSNTLLSIPESSNYNTYIHRPVNSNERVVSILDQLDARVEKFRKEALNLQEKKDYLYMSMDLIKSNEMLQNMSEAEREEVSYYIQRVNARLGTVDLFVHTVRDNSQEDSLSQINALIDTMIKLGDPVTQRQRCQLYLNACSSTAMDPNNQLPESDVGPIDKKFENALLGCTLDDQKTIKKRLCALMGYLNKQTVSH